MTDTGRVYFVGAGPGDPGLITRRGLGLLRSCDVVLFDRLVATELVDEAPENAERIFVGKSSTARSMSQAEIDALIVQHARAGKEVVRLKGGDPYVFGRGADEGQALAAAGISFEVVPGVTSATAVPSYAGIPLTHSGIASSFTVLTAHESSTRPEAAARWDALATGADTLVMLMGVSSLDEMMTRLIAAGRDPDEPCAVVEWGTTTRQRVVVATVASIAEKVRLAGIQPPATTIVGHVVKLRPALDWFGTRPLSGVRVVVTRATGERALHEKLTELGATVIHLPTIEIVDPPSFKELDDAIHELATGAHDWVAFSSVNGVEKVCGRVVAAGLDARAFASVKVAAVGASTASALRNIGIVADVVPDRFTGEALAAALGRGDGSVVLPRPVDAPRRTVDALEREGWKVREVAAYETRPVTPTGPAADAVNNGDFDAITFTSASTVTSFVAAMGADDPIARRYAFCIGPVTAEAARAAGLNVVAVADPHTVDGLVEAILGRMGR
ncbi:MAG: uroporphyrinogen-III C-methyltransferase [Actinomycetota bacterium]